MAVEYRVRPVTRHIVTRYEDGVGSTQIGEYPSPEVAHSVGHALCDAERIKAGEPLDSMAFVYPGVVRADGRHVGGFAIRNPNGAYADWLIGQHGEPTSPVTLTVDVSGAAGNDEVQRMVRQGVMSANEARRALGKGAMEPDGPS